MNQMYRQGIFVVIALAVMTIIAAGASRIAVYYPVASSSPSAASVKPATKSQVQTITYKGEEGKTVLELLQRSHKVEVQSGSFGTFVTSINGVAQTDNSAWLYYVDGNAGEVSSDKAVTNSGQTIEWRYESF